MVDNNNEINLDNVSDSLSADKAPLAMVAEQVSTENKIDDIFSETEKEKPAVLQAKQVEANMQTEESGHGGSIKKLIILIIVLLIFLATLGSAYFGYSYYIKGGKIPFLNSSKTINSAAPQIEDTEKNTGAANINQIPLVEQEQVGGTKRTPINFEQGNNGIVDTDGDGVSDQDEIVRGMNINSNDSDLDGLYDREEIMVYNTDPVNEDTDGDGFKDGDEVTGGYNPSGAGKLYDINGNN